MTFVAVSQLASELALPPSLIASCMLMEMGENDTL